MTSPIIQSSTLADWIYTSIQQEYQSIISYEMDVIKCAESLHQMRVCFRRLRAIINLFEVVLKLPNSLKDKYLRTIAKTLGELRDLDVLEEHLNGYLLNISHREQSYLRIILKKIDKHRQQIVTKINKLLKGKIYQQFKQSTVDWLAQPKYSPLGSLPFTENLPNLLLPSLSNLYLHNGWYINHLEGELLEFIAKQSKTLHGLRKRVKITRYQLTPFIELYPQEYQDYVADLKGIQKYLGNIQDSIVINELLTSYCLKNHQETLPEITEKINNFQLESWHSWQLLQQKHQQITTRNEWRKIIIS